MDPRVTLAGFAVGIVSGMSGIGGSSLLAPLLILVVGVPPTVAVGTDLVYSVPMKLIAAFGHLRQGTVDREVVRRLSIGGVPGTLAGLLAFWLFRAHAGVAQVDRFERHAIGIVILAAAASALVLMAVRRLRFGDRSVNGDDAGRRFDKLGATGIGVTGIGAVVGFLVALTSIGSGSMTLPLLLLALPALGLRSLIGSEIVFGAVIVPIAAVGHTAFATVDWRLALALAAGAVPGALVGVRLCGVLNVGLLRPAVMCALAYAGMKLL
ncbi:UPF0721 transmembrane protein [Vulcanimicrobium alpinum]|uniref:Probable membrane transporter protein n=2 Tax=Vulcanimicrobium alpinum TaxID=3016050 RepID=A0AAN1XSU5_UNVUL|nr:UPF0721 transmembrane protein [Vulcanimicrobium alpinum]